MTAAAATLTVSAINGAEEFAAIAVVRVQVTTWGGPAAVTEQDQPLPVKELHVIPVGNVSITVMVPVVGWPPLL